MRSSKSAGRVAMTAVFTALSLVVLFLSVLAPTGRLGLVAAAGLLPAAAVVSGGVGAGALCYAGTGLLAVVLLPDKGNALLYCLFFGLYPLVKCAIEQLRKLPLELFLKLLFFNLVFTGFWFGLRAVLVSALPVGETALWALYLAGNAAFLIYDFGFSKLIALYVARVDRPMRKGRQ